MTSPKSALLAAAALCAVCIPQVSWAQAGKQVPGLAAKAQAPMTGEVRAGSRFRCDSGRDIVAEFSSRGSDSVAIVDIGDGPHILPLRPWVAGGLPQITWTDGTRTLTWNAGVQLMWMDGGTHLMCGRAGGHNH